MRPVRRGPKQLAAVLLVCVEVALEPRDLRVATHVLAFEGDSQVTWFEGNFEAYEEHRHALLGAAADRPHRITYKRLVRG